MSNNPTEIFAERLAVQTRQHDATDPRLIACHFTAGWLAAVDALNAKGLAQDLAPAAPDADGWFAHRPGAPMPCAARVIVEYRLSDGYQGSRYAGDLRPPFNDSDWWAGCGEQIVAWRPAV